MWFVAVFIVATLGFIVLSVFDPRLLNPWNFLRPSDKELTGFGRKTSKPKRSLGLEAPRFGIDLIMGRGFDITKDATTIFNVLHLGKQKLEGKTGCYLPECIEASVASEVMLTCKVFESAEDMKKQRLKDLGIKVGSRALPFNFGYRDGYNYQSQQGLGGKFTIVLEKRLLKLGIRPEAPITPEFKFAVRNLPTNYDQDDRSNVHQWRSFFSTYGTHYISRAFLGGRVVFKMRNVDGSRSKSFSKSIHGKTTGVIKTIFGSGHLEEKTQLNGLAKNSRNLENLEILPIGGDSVKARELSMSRNAPEFLDRFSAWEDTVWENPVVTDSSISLVDITEAMKRCSCNPAVIVAMKGALEGLYNSGRSGEDTADASLLHRALVLGLPWLLPWPTIQVPYQKHIS